MNHCKLQQTISASDCFFFLSAYIFLKGIYVSFFYSFFFNFIEKIISIHIRHSWETFSALESVAINNKKRLFWRLRSSFFWDFPNKHFFFHYIHINKKKTKFIFNIWYLNDYYFSISYLFVFVVILASMLSCFVFIYEENQNFNSH